MTDDNITELERRAYARPDNVADAAAAQSRLAELAEIQRRTERGTNIDLPSVPEHSVAGAKAQAALGTAAALLAIAAVAMFVPHATSLDVFARAQTADDMPAYPFMTSIDLDTFRHIGSGKSIEIYGARAIDGGVCVSVQYTERAVWSCAPIDAFRRDGVEVQLLQGAYVEQQLLIVRWGPSGEPEIVTP